MLCHLQIAVLCFVPQEVMYFRFFLCHSFVAEHSRGSCRHPSWCPGSRSPSSDTSAWTSCWWRKSHTTGWRGRLFCFAFCLCSAPSICSVCYAASRLARVVLVNVRRLFCWSCGICVLSCLFLWRVVLACKAAFLAYLAFIMVFCLQL